MSIIARSGQTALLCILLAIIAPGIGSATPDNARTTARVLARVLTPVSLSYTNERNTPLSRLAITSPGKRTFQLHIGHKTVHSYSLHSQQHILHAPTTFTVNLLKSPPHQHQYPVITLYFN